MNNEWAETVICQLTAHSPQFTAHSPQFTVHSPQFTVHSSQSVVEDLVEFDFVDDWGVGGNAAGALDELVREVEAVFAACVHLLHAEEDALEHGLADDVDDGFAVAVGLLDDFAGEHVGAFEVEGDALSVLGVGSVALAEDFVVVAFLGLDDVLVLSFELLEVLLLLDKG